MDRAERLLREHEKSHRRTGWATSKLLATGSSQGVSLQAELDEPSPVMVQVDVQQPPSNIALVSAAVIFTCDGTPIQRAFDVAAGASICGVASAVRVVAVDQTLAFAPLAVRGIEYGVTLSIASRPRPTTAVPPIQTGARSQSVLAAGNFVVNVPSGASGVVVYGNATAGGPPTLTLQQLTNQDSIAEQFLLMSTNVTPGAFVPLMSGCSQVKVVNAGAAAALVTVCFSIDG